MRDVHNLEACLANALSNLEKTALPAANKKAIRDFVDDGLARGLSNGRVLKYIAVLKKVGELLSKDFDRAEKEDIQRVVRQLETSDYAEWTKHDFKAVLKKFYKWRRHLEYGFPDEVRWIKTTIRAKSKLPEELLSEEDVLRMIEAASHPRDKALVHVLYESGCRIGEILTLKIKNVQFDEYGGQIIVSGKTGMRRVRLVSSVPSLATWLNNHPMREDPNAPLWVCLATNRLLEPLSYRGAGRLLKELGRRAKIRKRIYPHLFRHSRLTELARRGVGESILKEFAGWTQRSEQAATYVHLSGRDIDSAILKLNGIEDKQSTEESKLKPRKCPRCRILNSPTAKFCDGCGAVLDAIVAFDVQEKLKKARWVEEQLDVRRLAEELREVQEQLSWLSQNSSATRRKSRNLTDRWKPALLGH